MMVSPRTSQSSPLPPVVTYAFAPVHKAALGVAFGLMTGALTAVATLFVLALSPVGAEYMGLLGQFFYGYTVSPIGAVVGFFWAFVAGFVAGWFVAFLKNLFTALWMFAIRTKAALTQPFLDHI
jgi:hypothetical protein